MFCLLTIVWKTLALCHGISCSELTAMSVGGGRWRGASKGRPGKGEIHKEVNERVRRGRVTGSNCSHHVYSVSLSNITVSQVPLVVCMVKTLQVILSLFSVAYASCFASFPFLYLVLFLVIVPPLLSSTSFFPHCILSPLPFSLSFLLRLLRLLCILSLLHLLLRRPLPAPLPPPPPFNPLSLLTYVQHPPLPPPLHHTASLASQFLLCIITSMTTIYTESWRSILNCARSGGRNLPYVVGRTCMQGRWTRGEAREVRVRGRGSDRREEESG